MIKDIQQLGLSETESKVYLAVLSLGFSGPTKIAEQAKVKRPTTYVALENLAKLGLVAEVFRDKKRFFKAENPEKLEKLTKKMRRQVIAAELKLEKLLPELEAIQKKIIEAPKLSFYQGIEGVKNIFDDFSGCSDSIYYFGSSEEILKSISYKELDNIMQETTKLRERAGKPKIYFITDKGIFKIKQFQNHDPRVREIKVLSEKIQSRSAIVAYSNKLAIININEAPFGAIVESCEIAKIIKIMFKIIWGTLK